MPRASRNLTDNGYYHVLIRGNNKKKISCITKHPNSCYLEMAKSNSERQQRFQKYVLQTRSHDSLLDDIFKIE
jgi:hypothetical protein